MAGRERTAAVGRTPFRVAVGRSLAVAAAFLLVTAGLFAAVGAWQSGGTEAADEQAAPTPDPEPGTASPTPAPEPDPEAEPQPEPAPEPDPAPDPAPSGPDPAGVSVQLLDAELDDDGAAVGRAAAALEEVGFDVVARNRVATSRASAYAETTVLYTPGFEAEGRLVAATLGATEVRAVTPENRLTDSVQVHVVVKG